MTFFLTKIRVLYFPTFDINCIERQKCASLIIYDRRKKEEKSLTQIPRDLCDGVTTNSSEMLGEIQTEVFQPVTVYALKICVKIFYTLYFMYHTQLNSKIVNNMQVSAMQ